MILCEGVTIELPTVDGGSTQVLFMTENNVTSRLIRQGQASYGVEVRTRDEDAGDPGWTDDAAAELKRNLLVANCFFGCRKRSRLYSFTSASCLLSRISDCQWR